MGFLVFMNPSSWSWFPISNKSPSLEITRNRVQVLHCVPNKFQIDYIINLRWFYIETIYYCHNGNISIFRLFATLPHKYTTVASECVPFRNVRLHQFHVTHVNRKISSHKRNGRFSLLFLIRRQKRARHSGESENIRNKVRQKRHCRSRQT